VKAVLVLSLLLVVGCASDGTGPPSDAGAEPPTLQTLAPQVRLAYLREAVVWSPIDTAVLDLRQGPDGGRWPPGTLLECDFVLPPEQPSGYTPKFLCRASDGETYKIKYGIDNREVYGEVIGSRLLWALGFRSDRVDPVRVKCHGCPEEPWDFMKGTEFWQESESPPKSEVRSFEPAVIETYHGTLMESHAEQGIAWDELLETLSPDAARAREQRVHREGLALLAGFLQHADSKPSQQTLSCAPGGTARDPQGAETCRSPEAYIGDIGAILGDGWKYKRVSTTKIDYARWKDTPVWRDPDDCVVAVNGRPNATLDDTPISEAARRFLAERLSLLSRDQLHDLFAVARVELLEEPIDANDWAEIFLEKASEIIEHRCPAAYSDSHPAKFSDQDARKPAR
jgi:hypothetical protein